MRLRWPSGRCCCSPGNIGKRTKRGDGSWLANRARASLAPRCSPSRRRACVGWRCRARSSGGCMATRSAWVSARRSSCSRQTAQHGRSACAGHAAICRTSCPTSCGASPRPCEARQRSVSAREATGHGRASSRHSVCACSPEQPRIWKKRSATSRRRCEPASAAHRARTSGFTRTETHP